MRRLFEFPLRTRAEGLHDITASVRQAIADSGVQSGIAVVYCPHTTAGITINENADPDVAPDLLFALNRAFPSHREFVHMEGNSAAHMKSSVVGAAQQIIIHGGKPLLGTWQGIFFCEFDGPRSRRFHVKILEG
ncbi:MAG: secondary thiamine-phosphate synthase enzyme YjbQ [Christensenellales bacterium]|jgi:secondary thiamine-phosphate synthase enzyme